MKTNAYTIRSFLDYLEKVHYKHLIEIEEEVSVDYETTAYFLALRKRNPVLLFKVLNGFKDFSLVTNIFGDEERLAMLTGFNSIEEFIYKWSDIANGNSYDLLIDDQNSHFHTKKTGDDIDIFKLPIPTHFELDGSKTGFSKYITSGLTTTKDPDNEEVINLSFARIQPFNRNRFAFDTGSRGHLWKYLNISKERGEKLEMTILIGPNPVFYLLAASFIDNEFKKASKLYNIEFTRGYMNDIPIPIDTEIAIEAEFSPDEEFDEGPFAEYVGYMGYDSTRFVGKVRSILMKKYPIYYDIQPSNSSEHVNLFSIPRSSIVLRSIEETLPKGPRYKVVWPHYGGRFISFGYVNMPDIILAKQLGISLLGLDPLWNKIVFVNAGTSELTLLKALVNLAQIDEFSDNDIIRFHNILIIGSDPTRDEMGTSGKVVFLTQGKNSKFEIDSESENLMLKTDNGNVLISHDKEADQKVNIIVPEDIDINDEEQVGWAIATRLNPDRDLILEKNKIIFYATRNVPPVARVPPRIKEKIEKKLISLSK